MSKVKYAYSIKEIAEFCCRTGDYRYSETPSPTAKQGQDIHRFLQEQSKQSTDGYQAEAAVKHHHSQQNPVEDYELIIRGRADAFWVEGDTLHVEEIKTTFYEEVDLPEPIYLVHLAQAKLYAYLLAKENPEADSDQINISLTYWHLAKENHYRIDSQATFDQLEEFFEETVREFSQWLDKIHEHRIKRNQYIENLDFPFDTYREGQKTVAAACYKSVTEQDTTFIHAATGIGKSLSTLFGTLKAVPNTKVEQIWYLTAKTSGKTAIDQALDHLSQQGKDLKVLHLLNRDTTCFCSPSQDEDSANDNEPCTWEVDYYSKKQLALEELFKNSFIDLETLQSVSQTHKLCPHHLAQDILPWVDVIIVDFNFVFSFTARNTAYLEKPGKTSALLIDETHNLVSRCRDLYEAELNTDTLDQVKTVIAPSSSKAATCINSLKNTLKSLSKETTEFPHKLFEQIENLRTELSEWQQQSNLLFLPEEIIEVKIALAQWLRLSKYLQDGLGAEFGHNFSLIKSKRKLALLSNNPAPVAQELSGYFNNRVFFSGSLLPLRYFTTQLSTTPQDSIKQLVAHSPFPPDRLNVALGNLNLNYQNREASISKALSYIETLWKEKPGLYLICAASYQYLEMIQSHIENHIDIPHLFQQRFDTQEAKDGFSESLRNMTEGFACIVMGGSFGEGVEWPPGVLKGVIILGSGMPSPSTTQDRLQQYFDHNDLIPSNEAKGFEYTYLFPAINRIIQTVGRIQRQNKDAGIALILDKRFRQARYRKLFPPTWQPQEVNSLDALSQLAKQFWDTID